MPRFSTLLALALLVMAVALSIRLWQQGAARVHLQQALDLEVRRVEALREQAAAEATRRTNEPSGATLGLQNSTQPEEAALPAAIAARDALRKDVADRAKRRNVLHRYIAGFEALALPPATATAVKDLLVQQAAAPASKTFTSAAEYAAAFKAAEVLLRQRVGALIGTDAAEILMASADEGTLDWSIGTDLWDAGVPLEPNQIQLLAQSALRSGFDPVVLALDRSESTLTDPATGLSPHDVRFLHAAQSYLTPAQREALKTSLLEENQYRRALQLYSEKMNSPGVHPK
jgi:hypothetical protein